MASSFLAVAATFTLAAQPYSSTGLPNFPKSWSVRESQHAKVEGSLVVWDGMVYNDQQNISRPHCKYCWLLQQRGTVCARSQLHPAQQIRSGLRNRQRRLILYFVCMFVFLIFHESHELKARLQPRATSETVQSPPTLTTGKNEPATISTNQTAQTVDMSTLSNLERSKIV